MRISTQVRIVPAVLLAMALGGCEDFLDVNENPNAPERVRVDLRVPALITGFGHSVYYGAPQVWSGEWVQQYSYNRETRSYDELHRYELQDNSPNGPWNFYFAQVLNEARLMIAETSPETEPAIHGLSKFIWAWTWAHTTDLWGPIPFKEAFNPNILEPKYDDQPVVYEAVHKWFEEAIADMKKPSSRTPGANDLLFGGNMARWVKLARVVQARHHLRLAYAPWENRQQRAQAALTALQEGFTSNADEADFTYPGGAGARNPLWVFQDLWTQLKASDYMLERVLRARDDPRLPIMVRPAREDSIKFGAKVYRGHKNGASALPDSTISEVGYFFTNENARLNWVSYADAKFTEAEARLIVSGPAAADAPYREGIRANMLKLGVSASQIAAYLAARRALASLADPLEEIIREKYIANYLKIEPWHDWRRTGYPRLDLVQGAVIPGIPLRIRTPAVEVANNVNSVKATGIDPGLQGMLWKSDKVWWGAGPRR